MVLLVPFDGSDLAVTALERAVEFGNYRDEEVVALSVVPPDEQTARERGWLRADESDFDAETIERRLREQVESVAPDATFRVEHVDETSPEVGASTTTDVIRRIREVAAEVDASIVFVGSENAGQVAAPSTSVGGPIAENPQYDVHIIRQDD